MIFALKEKNSDDWAFLHDLYMQPTPPLSGGLNAISLCTCTPIRLQDSEKTEFSP